MATIIPNIHSVKTKMTAGERRFGQRLEQFLEDDYYCWFDVPVGRQRRYPDFIILHPRRGLLLLEVKDWKPATILRLDHSCVELRAASGVSLTQNPIAQARDCAYQVVNQLKKDPALMQLQGKHKGQLACPYGYGAVFTQITRKQLNDLLGEEGAAVLPAHLIICQDEMQENTDAEAFQQRLWGMFNYVFSQKLTLPQIDKIRGHLFPEIRINPTQSDFFANEEGQKIGGFSVPDIIKVMDIQQEQLARSFGEGHRIVHGVAGSGKTLILGFRCWYLAQTQSKPILVLCFNITLAAKLRAFMRAKGIGEQVQVYHFHDWCGQQLKTYHVDIIASKTPLWERQVNSVIAGVEKQQIPREQYGAVLIDEGHDFEADWLKLIVQMIDSESKSLLLLYDDAQSIYPKKNRLNFSLASVGVEARGRTTILKLNYRNTRQILQFAYGFAQEYMGSKEADDDGVPLIKPEMAGNFGPEPHFKMALNNQHESEFICQCLLKWHADGVAWQDMAIIYCDYAFSQFLLANLRRHNIPAVWLGSRANRLNYNPALEQVILVTRQSSKGLEFPRVIVAGLGGLNDTPQERPSEIRLLYVAMTRAQQTLLVTSHQANFYTQQLERRQ